MTSLLKISNVYKEYKIKKDLPVKAVNGISLDVNSGEFIAICGVSGSGKSTLLHLIGGVFKPDSGDINVTDKDGTVYHVEKMNLQDAALYRNKITGYVLQDFGLIPYRSVKENVAVPLYINGESSRNIEKKVNDALQKVGVLELGKRPISKLSGGQKQRVAIARALINDPLIILADEPTGALDSETKRDILLLFRKLADSGKTIIMVTHDTEAAKLCDRIINIKDGKIE